MDDEALASQFRELGCNVRSYQPDQRLDPERWAWEVVLPNPDVVVPQEVVEKHRQQREHRDI